MRCSLEVYASIGSLNQHFSLWHTSWRTDWPLCCVHLSGPKFSEKRDQFRHSPIHCFVYSRSDNDLITNSISNQLEVLWWVISWIACVHKVNPKHLLKTFVRCFSFMRIHWISFVCSLFMLFRKAPKVNGAEKYSDRQTYTKINKN